MTWLKELEGKLYSLNVPLSDGFTGKVIVLESDDTTIVYDIADNELKSITFGGLSLREETLNG